MNLQQFYNILEVERTGSFTRAAENLCMSQPNLSRSVRELESELGFAVFQRTSKGILPTHEGEELLRRAKNIVAQIGIIQGIGKPESEERVLRVSVPRASYISTALCRLVERLSATDRQALEIDYKETNALRAIENLLKKNYDMSIVRYNTFAEPEFLSLFQEKELRHETLADYSTVLVMSQHHPLAQRPRIVLDDLAPYIELTQGDPFIPSLNYSQAKQAETVSPAARRIAVYERGSQFDLLCNVPGVYMWSSLLPEQTLRRYELVCRPCDDVSRRYKDVLIYPHGYRLRTLDKQFVAELKQMCREVFGGTPQEP